MAKGKHGTRLHGIPSATDIRRVRRGHIFISVTDDVVDPNIGACRVQIQNIAAARELRVYRGRPINTVGMLAVLDELERAQVPLRNWESSPAEALIVQT